MDYIIYYAISGFVFGFVCNAILKGKGYGTDENPNYGFWWGFFLGVLGLVVCVCKKRIETSTSTKNGDVEEIEKWVCPNCGKENPIHFFECECGYHNEDSHGLNKSLSNSLIKDGFWKCPRCNKIYSKYAKSCDCGFKK